MSCSSTCTVKDDGNFLLNESSTLVTDEGLSLANLPTDILLHIFVICGRDLWPVIAQVCHRFYTILGPDSFLWEQIARQLLFVNQSSSAFRSKYIKF